jgi:hypothetical protein
MTAPPEKLLFQPVWSQTLLAPPRGIQWAREKDWLLAWDDAHWLYLFDGQGKRQAQKHTDGPLVTACAADDGSAYVALTGKGEVCWLAPDLMPRWQHALPQPGVTAALDPFGQYVAVATQAGALHFFNRRGQPLRQVDCPRPFRHLAFVPGAAALVGCADYGLVACLDWQGQWLWRDGLVAYVGSLACSGDGELIVLACFGEGIQCYPLAGPKRQRLPGVEGSRLAAVSFDGQRVLAEANGNQVVLLNPAGEALARHAFDKPVAGLALDALGRHAAVALADGTLQFAALVKKEG